MSTNDFSHGLLNDGAAILKNGIPLSIEEIVSSLTEGDQLKERVIQLEHSVQDSIYESGFAEVKELGLEDGSKAQKAFWHALEFCNDPENRNIRQHWENYKQLLQEQAA